MMLLTSCSFKRAPHAGMTGERPVAAPPCVIVFFRSASLFAVLLRSFGFGFRLEPTGPSPFPEGPWQVTQSCSYFAFPAPTSPDCALAVISILIRAVTAARNRNIFFIKPLSDVVMGVVKNRESDTFGTRETLLKTQNPNKKKPTPHFP